VKLTLGDARDIATVVAAVVAIISVRPLFRNLHASELSLRSRVYFDTLTLLDGKEGEVRDLRHLLEQQIKLAKASGKQFDILTTAVDVRQRLDKLARAYDKVGLLVKHGAVPVDFLFDFYSRPIVVAWTQIRPLVQSVRNDRGQPGHMLKFEILAIGASVYRLDKYSEPSPFPISAEDTARWKKWNRWRMPGRFRKPSA
jgi:hypothetical protein